MTATEYQQLLHETSQSLPFKDEGSLVQIVIKNITTFVDGGNIYASTEVPIGSGIVDIVAANVIDTTVRGREHVRLGGQDAYVLSRLFCRQRLTLNTIARRVNLESKIVERIVQRLISYGYAKADCNCYVRISPMIADLVAIEGKRRDWKVALRQAYRNRVFTNQSFVALDARYARPALENLTDFKKANIGLAVVFQDGRVTLVHTPNKMRPQSTVMPIVAETALTERISKGK